MNLQCTYRMSYSGLTVASPQSRGVVDPVRSFSSPSLATIQNLVGVFVLCGHRRSYKHVCTTLRCRRV